jgi:hypothetical protein
VPPDDYGALKRAPGHLSLRIPIDYLGMCTLFLFDTNEHFIEQITLKLLPGLKIFADTDSAMKAQSSKSVLSLAEGTHA